MSDSPAPITPGYDAEGVEGFYRSNAATYRNPHEDEVRSTLRLAVQRWTLELSSVLDLACGSGEMSLELDGLGAAWVEGIDPYTQQAYLARTGLTAASWTFADVADGVLEGRHFSLIVCSYALHLCEVSRLPGVCLALARIAPALLILSPHKRPVIKPGWGWSAPQELIHRRVHARYHQSTNPG